MRICKKCLLIEQAGKEKEIVYQYLAELPKKERTPQQEFEQRLDQCRNCDWLVSATCQACGCYVEVRAGNKKNKCPYHKW